MKNKYPINEYIETGKIYPQNTPYSEIIRTKKGVWRKINGTPVFIKNGQSVEEAFDDLKKSQTEKRERERKNDFKKLETAVNNLRSTYRETINKQGYVIRKVHTWHYIYGVKITNGGFEIKWKRPNNG